MLYNLKTGIRVFRNGGSLGLAVERDDHSEIAVSSGTGGCFHVLHVTTDGAVASEGSIEAGDKIVECNGASVGSWSMEEFVGRVRVAEDPIVFSVLKCGGLHGSLEAAAAEVERLMDASTTGENDGNDSTSIDGGETEVADSFGGETSGSRLETGNIPEAKSTRVGRLKKMILRQRAPTPRSEKDIDGKEEMQLMESLEIRIKTNGGQLGAMLSMNKDGSWFVKGIIDGSAVALNGNMKEGDRVERVNGRNIIGLPMDDIRPMLRSHGVVVFDVSRPLHEVSLMTEDTDDSEFVKEIEALKNQVRSLKAEIRSKDSEIDHLHIALENARRTNTLCVPGGQPKMMKATHLKPKLYETISLNEQEVPLDDDRNDTLLIPREEEDSRETECRDNGDLSRELRTVNPIDIIDPSLSRRWIDSSVE
uniref:PDZ domain-containing protein n=1 Tax=Odontella aurita TaxID=265563 RepID=A0A7S4J5U6_9STRA|mmetsp:Transcript_393/g.1153  ORF Transcript_393/g.1153 Transcript_393/m.1153 type:complete len:421 (+) Transcript_393:330-1592(+)